MMNIENVNKKTSKKPLKNLFHYDTTFKVIFFLLTLQKH